MKEGNANYFDLLGSLFSRRCAPFLFPRLLVPRLCLGTQRQSLAHSAYQGGASVREYCKWLNHPKPTIGCPLLGGEDRLRGHDATNARHSGRATARTGIETHPLLPAGLAYFATGDSARALSVESTI